MGIGRFLQERDLKKDLKKIEQFPDDAKQELKTAVHHAEGFIEIKLKIPVSEILESENFHVVENVGWGKTPMLINTQIRIPLMRKMHQGDPSSISMYFGVSIILHSIRAIMDYEYNQNKKLLFWCQKLWYEFSADDISNIPPRFRGSA
jgi:hypothetical protein